MFGDGADAVGEFAANAMYFAIGVLAYHLAQRLKRQVLPEPYCTATVATLRWKLYRLVAKLVRHARDGGCRSKRTWRSGNCWHGGDSRVPGRLGG